MKGRRRMGWLMSAALAGMVLLWCSMGKLNADERQNGYSAYQAMMAVAYALMLMGMNSNKTTDVLAGGMGGFLLSCAAFTLLFAAIAREILKRRDVRA